MSIQFEKDAKIKIHAKGAIAQLCSVFRSHEQGLPEWMKNSNTAYANVSAASEDRVVTILFGTKGGQRFIALLDHVGMSVEDIEGRFSDWGNPDAFKGDDMSDEIREGGHGNGGKCYMTQMFESHSYLHTVKNSRGSRYGFVGDEPNPGYFPNKQEGRGFPVSKAADELRRALSEIGVEFGNLPEEVRAASARRDGFTLIVGVTPRNFDHKDAGMRLIDAVVVHPQSLLTLQTCRVHVVVNGKPVPNLCPLRLPEILPNPDVPEPRIVPIPQTLIDPETEAVVETRDPHAPEGRLVLKTSKGSMRSKLRGRHNITYFAYGYPLGALEMEDVGRSYWIDRMYGECQLDELRKYETNDRRDLANAPLTRALKTWTKDQVIAFDAEFKKKERLEASQAQQEQLKKQNEFLNKWIQKSLDTDLSPETPGSGRGKRETKPRPARPEAPAKVQITSQFHSAGVGVALPLRVTFKDEEDERVGAVPFMWHSSDWAAATVDEDLSAVVTHSPGTTSVWVETLDGKLRSNAIDIDVIQIQSIVIEPSALTIEAGRFVQLNAIVTDDMGNTRSDVYLTWIQDDSSIISVTATGKVMGRRAGSASVTVGDDNYTDENCRCNVTVTPASESGDSGRAYPKIVLSEIEADPLNPDGEPCHLSPEDGPVHQPTPQHVQRNVWFINMSCPLARYYFGAHGPNSTEWRMYHLERFIEAFVKIQLTHIYQEDENTSFDEFERVWREKASEVQARAMEELAEFLQGSELAESAAAV